MAKPTVPEIAAQVVVREGIEKRPLMGTSGEAAKRLAEGLTASNWRERLTIASEPQIDRRKIAQRVEKIGLEIDDSGKRTRTPDSDGDKRHTRATDAVDFDLKFLEKGYSQSEPADQVKIQKAFVELVGQNPLIAERYSKLTKTQKEAFERRYLQSPEFTQEVRKILAEIQDEEPIPDQTSEIQDRIDLQTVKVDVKGAEVTAITDSLEAVETQLKTFSRADPSNLGENAQEIDRLAGIVGGAADRISDYTSQERNLQEEIQRRESQKLALIGRTLKEQAQIDAYDQATKELRDQRDRITKDKNDLQGSVAKLDGLKVQQRELEERKNTLSREKGEKDIEQKELELELRRQENELTEAKSLRVSAEERLTGRLEGVFSEASRRLLNKDMEQYADSAIGELERQKKETEDAKKKAFETAEQSHWTRTDRSRVTGKEKPVIDVAHVREDLREALKAGVNAREAVVRHILQLTYKPGSEPATRYTDDEIKEIMQDQEFVKTMGDSSLRHLISRGALAGSISQEDISLFILNTDWGKEIVTQGISQSEEAQRTIEEVMGKDALKRPDFMQRFAREMSGSKNLLWLIFLLGAGVVKGVASPASAAIRAAKAENPYI